jgi:hypothetical protein
MQPAGRDFYRGRAGYAAWLAQMQQAMMQPPANFRRLSGFVDEGHIVGPRSLR